MTCLITGCRATYDSLEVSGDLHRVGDCYVFNAIVDVYGVSRWRAPEKGEYAHYTKVIDFSESSSYYEKRGVLIAPISECVLNEKAKEYIK